MFLRTFFPDEYYNSTYDIDYDKLYASGMRGIIFDIDNTLVPHGAPPDARSKELFSKLNDLGFKCILLSNNREGRVKSFAKGVKYTDYIYRGGKPSRKGYLRSMDMMGTDRKNTVFIGDQLFTDVWGAKRTGIKSILVHQIDKKEEIQIVLKRILENIVLHFYFKEQDSAVQKAEPEQRR
ncbi:MAG: YqeG family HAD IIIA-type phosphatase [Lachnospiraceae bacterium]|nr:YqeG family HAD IIIA-type phosphatase [Lachnospiraceae bacterium]